MPRYRPTIVETVYCSTRDGAVFAKEMSVTGKTVTLTRIVELTPELTLQQIQDCGPQHLLRHYRGPVLNPDGLNDVCPFCGNAHIHDCPSCHMLTRCAAEVPQTCPLCRHQAASAPLGDTTLPKWAMKQRYTLGERLHDIKVFIEELTFAEKNRNVWTEFERPRRDREKPRD